MAKKQAGKAKQAKALKARAQAPSSKPSSDASIAEDQSKQGGNAYSHVSLLTHPVLTVKVLIILIGRLVKASARFVLSNYLAIIALIGAIAAFKYAPGPHVMYRQAVSDFLYFAAWWIGLGIASSVGFGTGLHTFVLYLGPHIAKVTMASNECNYVPEILPSRWSFHHFKACPPFEGTPTVPVLSIYYAVIVEAFLWGLGTAIGELPPYYVARAASLAGKKHEELAEMIDESKVNSGDLSKLPLMERAKIYIYKTLKKRAFIAILLLASIPNPLFDLAGFLCGHFLIPFATFFGAAFIGKAIIKVSIQSFFVIFCFSQHQVQIILDILRGVSPKLEEILHGAIEKQKKTLFAEQVTEEARPIIAIVWEYIVLAMIAYFIYSIISSLVQNYLQEEADGSLSSFDIPKDEVGKKKRQFHQKKKKSDKRKQE